MTVTTEPGITLSINVVMIDWGKTTTILSTHRAGPVAPLLDSQPQLVIALLGLELMISQ